jgi:hypothetical protein
MPYRFHRVQTHPKLSDLQGWYLELRADDIETLMKVHQGVVSLYYGKFGVDPHLQADEARRTLYNPIHLAACWLRSADRFLTTCGVALVNVNGGLMLMEDAIILETVESDDIDWNLRYDDEIVTISRWPEGKHWYLSSNKDRIFVPSKCDHYSDALTAALRFVPVERIRNKN